MFFRFSSDGDIMVFISYQERRKKQGLKIFPIEFLGEIENFDYYLQIEYNHKKNSKNKVMKIYKKKRSLLVCFSVIAFLLSSCLPVMDSVTLVGFKNCTNDTLIIGESDCNDIDSAWWFGERFERPSKEPLLTSIDSILLDVSKNYLESCEFYDEEDKAITPTELAEKNREEIIVYPDSLLFVDDYSLFDKYFFLIKLDDAKNHSWDEIRTKKLYKKWFTVKKKDGEFDTNIKYLE